MGPQKLQYLISCSRSQQVFVFLTLHVCIQICSNLHLLPVSSGQVMCNCVVLARALCRVSATSALSLPAHT